MELAELQALLAGIPDVSDAEAAEVAPVDDAALTASIDYLASDEARASLARDVYWPKWDSPWWHMLLLFELGLADRIPAPAVRAMVDGLNGLRVKIFPIHPGDRPPGADHYRDSSCHCAVGCMHQVLTACGVDVAAELPWIEDWFPRYLMADGGANCDEEAYLSGEPDASSMVGTVAMFEAALARSTPALEAFLDRAAGFLVGRRLVDGSPSRHNAEERDVAPTWHQPTFPRFYFHDNLRGLAALVRWADSRGRTLPLAAVVPAAASLAAAFPDGIVPTGRRGFDLHPTTLGPQGDSWGRIPTTTFPLLDSVSVLGAPSAPLTRHWRDARRTLLSLAAAGRLT